MLFELLKLTGNCYCLQYNAGLLLESFSVELVVLAIWKKALQICSSCLASAAEGELPESSSTNEVQGRSHINFSRSSSWAEQGFIVAFNRADKLSNHIKNMDVDG